MPADSGLAFGVVLHLDPRHHSELASFLGHRTAMPVADIVDGIRIEPNRVYVIVPDKSLRVDGDQLRLSEPAEPRGHRHPVDVFFVSLAEHRRERAIAIVLSGTGSNGTQGMKEVKASGGLAVVQDPATAQFDGMPRSAVTAGGGAHRFPPREKTRKLLFSPPPRSIVAPRGAPPPKRGAPPGPPPPPAPFFGRSRRPVF